jgi:hypothetical protein
MFSSTQPPTPNSAVFAANSAVFTREAQRLPTKTYVPGMTPGGHGTTCSIHCG